MINDWIYNNPTWLWGTGMETATLDQYRDRNDPTPKPW
jgi:hypothetical protein